VSCFLSLLTAAIAAQLAPQTKAKIVYGDEGFGRVVESGPHIQVLDDPTGDTFGGAPTTQGGSTPTRYRKATGVLVRIKGASSKPGATIKDHRGVVEALTDLLVITIQEVAHAPGHSLDVIDITGNVVDDLTDEVGANPASAEYTLRCKVVRGLNKAKAVEALTGLVVEREIIAHRLVVAPTEGASITAVAAGGVATVGGLSGIDASYVGKTLTLTGGTVAANAGDFIITAVIDSATVQITNAAASIDSGLTWSVSDDELAQES
jgi:hypothetical protein